MAAWVIVASTLAGGSFVHGVFLNGLRSTFLDSECYPGFSLRRWRFWIYGFTFFLLHVVAEVGLAYSGVSSARLFLKYMQQIY